MSHNGKTYVQLVIHIVYTTSSCQLSTQKKLIANKAVTVTAIPDTYFIFKFSREGDVLSHHQRHSITDSF